MRWIHQWPMNSQHKGPVRRKKFPFDDVIMFYYLKRLCFITFTMPIATSVICPKNIDLHHKRTGIILLNENNNRLKFELFKWQIVVNICTCTVNTLGDTWRICVVASYVFSRFKISPQMLYFGKHRWVYYPSTLPYSRASTTELKILKL